MPAHFFCSHRFLPAVVATAPKRTQADFTFQPEWLEPRIVLADVSGALIEWQPMAVTFAGPSTTELSAAPNPFLDYRLDVTFTNGNTGQSYRVPGYFAGNGSGEGTGNHWRVNFTPDEPGAWSYQASFRTGSAVAVSLDPSAGTPAAFNGESGTFNIAERQQNAPGFLGVGRLEYVGGHYYKFRDGSYWLKGGADSPENFLGYKGFDNTPNAHHDFSTHVSDWTAGDPDWGGGKGKGIIGALNYLSQQEVNSIYFLPMNIGGDGKDTWPFPGPIATAGSAGNDNLHYDISKLAQWDVVFAHAQEKGIQLHIVLNEAEGANKKELDNGTLGNERKLYYREMVARFGHHNAIQWNISEEYDYKHPWTPSQVKEFAGYLQAVDPYDHPITVHNQANPDSTWTPFVGDSRLSATSLQYSGSTAGHGDEVEEWRARTAASGRPIPIFMDELRSTSTSNQDDQRVELLWPTYMSGGSLEYYVGGSDVSLDNFRSYEDLWTWTRYARSFFEDHLPFWEMTPADNLLAGETSNDGGGQVFKKTGDVYAVYLAHATNSGTLNLSEAPNTAFEQVWFNPRTGKFEGSMRTVQGGGTVALGAAPNTASEDWVALFRRTGTTPPPDPDPDPEPDPGPDPTTGPTVTRLVLVDADRDVDLMTLVDGQRIDLSTLPTRNLNIRADVGAGVDYVIFHIDGDQYSTENGTPYALAGDRSGDYRHWTPEVGDQAISAAAYDSHDVAGPAHEVALTVVDGPSGEVVAVAAPTNLTAALASPTSIALEWIDNADNEQNLLVERSVNTAPFSLRATLPASTTQYVDANLLEGNTYTYRVRAVTDGSVYSAYSNTANAHTPSAAPTAPSGLTASAVSSTRIDLAWTDNSGSEQGFHVYRAPAGTTTWTRVATVAANAATYSDPQLAASTSYTYYVAAFNAGGSSGPSNTATAATQAPVTTGPRVTSLTLIDASKQRVLRTLVDGDVIDRAALGSTKFNIRAEVAGSVGSVRWGFDGNASYRMENEAPWALFGDVDGVYRSWSPTPGIYSVTATAFGSSGAKGTAGGSIVLTFRVM